MGTLTGAYTDPAHLYNVPFGRRSHWWQPWRSYLETVPVARALAGIGTNFNVQLEDPFVVAQMLARSGIRRARIEMGWNVLDYATEQVQDPSGRLAARLLACARFGLRPLILLNANAGAPCPFLQQTRTLTAALRPGDNTAQLDTTAGLVPGYSGLSYLPTATAGLSSLMAGHLVTGLGGDGHTCALSQPIGAGSTTAAGLPVRVDTLKYRPFSGPATADYAQTSAGWGRYALGVARWVAATLGTGGRADLGFDLEVWNELTFGSEFLQLSTYYRPDPYNDPNTGAWGAGSHNYQILQDTAALIAAHPADFAGATIVNGFGNTIPWPSSSDEPAAVTGISFHPYNGNFIAPDHPPAGTAVDALGRVDTSGYEPTYRYDFPEYFLCAVQTESTTRNCGPLTDPSIGPKGRYARPAAQGGACWGWATEMGRPPNEAGITDVAAGLRYKAKYNLRSWLGWLGKGNAGVLPFAVAGAGDGTWAQALDAFLAYARTSGTYPAADQEAAYTSPTFAALRRACATLGVAADQSGAGAAALGPDGRYRTRALDVRGIADTHDNVQFAGDGTAAHPSLFDRDCLVVQPFQANAYRFVIAYWVMTRDLSAVRQPSRGSALQYDLPPETFTVTLGGLRASAALIWSYDPLDDAPVPVVVRAADDSTLVVDLPATDAPRLLIVQERTSAAMAASSYLQNARLNWMRAVAFPSPPDQWVGLHSVAPTNTTGGTELSAGNYARVQVGLARAAAPTVTPTGTAGSTSYSYQVIKKNAAGSTLGTTASTGTGVTTTTTGNAALTSSNYNAISWTADAAATSYDVLKWSGSAWTLLGTTSATSLNDTGQSTTSYSVPTANGTGWTTIVAGATETISNALPLTWPVANVDWGTAVACAIFDAPTGGNMLDFASLTNAQAIAAGSQLSLPASQFILGES